MESVLQKICQAHKANNTLFQRDWESVPLPTLPREGKLQSKQDSSGSTLFIGSAKSQMKDYYNEAICLTRIFLFIGPHYTIKNAQLENPDISAGQSLFFSNPNNPSSSFP